MTENPNPSHVNKTNTDEQGRRTRIIWVGSIANLTLIMLFIELWFQRDLTVQLLLILALPLLLVVNGALWLGSRVGRWRTNRRFQSRLCFASGGLAGADAIFEAATGDRGSAETLLIGCVAIITLGVLVMRNKVKQDASQSRHG